jgi:hypothetical protein
VEFKFVVFEISLIFDNLLLFFDYAQNWAINLNKAGSLQFPHKHWGGVEDCQQVLIVCTLQAH